MKKLFNLSILIFISFLLYAQGSDVHILQKGETLFSVSRKYNVSVALLQDYNSIKDPTSLQVGSRLKIPYVHVVRKGENLFQISRKYKVDLKGLYALNNLDSNSIIYEGDRILLPKNSKIDSVNEKAETTPSIIPDTNDTDIWPHPGTRTALDGKLNGVEISASKGDEFISISSGRVLFCAAIRGYGYVIMIRTGDNYVFKYSGADLSYVRYGQIIEPGMKLGKVGENPHDGEVKLLFSVYLNGAAVDPGKAPRG